MAVRGGYFERVLVLFNNNISLEQDVVGKATTSGDQQVNAVGTMTSNHLNSGFVRGNAQYSLNLSIFQTSNGKPIDFTSIDYDNTLVTVALYCPAGQFGSNVFAGSKKYLLCTGLYLSTNDELEATGVGQPVTSNYNFKCINQEWVSNI